MNAPAWAVAPWPGLYRRPPAAPGFVGELVAALADAGITAVATVHPAGYVSPMTRRLDAAAAAYAARMLSEVTP